MGRVLTWLVTAPLSLAGVELGHALINAIVGSPTGATGEWFEARGPGAGLVPWFSAAAVVLVLLGLGARIAGWWPPSDARRASPLPFAFVAPTAFILQEHLETILHSGGLTLSTVMEPTFLPGLALQAPFALAAYLVARFLLRVADVVRARIGRARPRRPTPRRASTRFTAVALHPRVSQVSSACSGRAPPVGVIARR